LYSLILQCKNRKKQITQSRFDDELKIFNQFTERKSTLIYSFKILFGMVFGRVSKLTFNKCCSKKFIAFHFPKSWIYFRFSIIASEVENLLLLSQEKISCLMTVIECICISDISSSPPEQALTDPVVVFPTSAVGFPHLRDWGAIRQPTKIPWQLAMAESFWGALDTILRSLTHQYW
jgi:hypothetical protein